MKNLSKLLISSEWCDNSTAKLAEEILVKLNAQYSLNKNKFYPSKESIFHCLNLTTFHKTKVIILGQDPYHGSGQANGLAFSVKENIPIPPSLKNIFKELIEDLQISNPPNGNLESWSKQGVLLLNSILTVEDGKPGSHKKLNWEIFTDSIIKKLSREKESLVFMLWGTFAQKKSIHIDESKHLILKAPHPSPLSAYRGFLGCKHFSKCNDFLKRKNKTPIDWKL